MFQIVFNEISAAEISRLDTLEQLDLLDEFKVTEKDLESLDGDRFGKIDRDGKTLYRFRAKDWRFYFEVKDGHVDGELVRLFTEAKVFEVVQQDLSY